jgi:ABC-type nickel/cobalt efflux system permease component RcnA
MVGTDSQPSLPEQQENKAPEHEGRLRGSYLGRFLGTGNAPPLRRRLRFAVVVVISQLLLIALAIAWLIHMIIIASEGSVHFVERNPLILWIEVAATILIIIFATSVFFIQLKRLGERRQDDRRGSDRD